MVNVEIIYIPIDETPLRILVRLNANSTVQDALEQSEIIKKHPEINSLTVGIFSKEVSRSTALRDGDRLEIYQALKIDPKAKRRERAKKKNNYTFFSIRTN